MAFLQIPQEFANRSLDEIVASAGTGNSLPLIPEGKYQGVFVTSEMKPTQAGGQFLELKFVITQGQHRDTELSDRLNLVNSNPTAVKIAYETLAKIAKAVGLDKIPNDSAALHNRPLVAVVKTEPGKPFKDKQTGEERQGKDHSVLDGKYEQAPSVGGPQMGAAPVGFGAPPAVAAANVHPTDAPISW